MLAVIAPSTDTSSKKWSQKNKDLTDLRILGKLISNYLRLRKYVLSWINSIAPDGEYLSCGLNPENYEYDVGMMTFLACGKKSYMFQTTNQMSQYGFHI